VILDVIPTNVHLPHPGEAPALVLDCGRGSKGNLEETKVKRITSCDFSRMKFFYIRRMKIIFTQSCVPTKTSPTPLEA
jgi:hypothetical protein